MALNLAHCKWSIKVRALTIWNDSIIWDLCVILITRVRKWDIFSQNKIIYYSIACAFQGTQNSWNSLEQKRTKRNLLPDFKIYYKCTLLYLKQDLLCSIGALFNKLNRKRIWKGIHMCICITESLCCTPKTNKTLLINYNPIQNKNFLNKQWIKIN